MSKKKLKIIIVEDKADDLADVSRYVADADVCEPEDLKFATTYDEARDLINAHAQETDLVLLDLNIPRRASEAAADNEQGALLLAHIHDLNQREHRNIQVFIVSAQVLSASFHRAPLMNTYSGTLVGFVDKADLADSLTSSLARFEVDPLRARIIRTQLGVVKEYDTVVDATVPIRERLNDACTIAIRLLRNDMDYTYRNPNASVPYADKLNDLIRKLKDDRFRPGNDGKKYIAASEIDAPGGWSAFLWRGCLEQHLQTLLRYRNDYTHIKSKPFRSPTGAADDWEIPKDVLESVESGNLLGKAIEFIVRDLLLWYLPWHEQVFMAWKKKNARGVAP